MSVQALFGVAMANPAWDLISFGASVTGDEGPSTLVTPHAQDLLDLRMKALTLSLQHISSKSEAWKILKWIHNLLNVMDGTNDPDS